jgi:uncharacterized protein YeaO (DUF488 family)
LDEGQKLIQVKRAYDAPSANDGVRYLVDRLWPRGITKESLQIEAWLKEAAPSGDLRKRFHGNPEEWSEFCLLYFDALKKNSEAWAPIVAAAKKGTVTLIYGARDTEHNNAVALRDFLLNEAHAGVRK